MAEQWNPTKCYKCRIMFDYDLLPIEGMCQHCWEKEKELTQQAIDRATERLKEL